MSLHDSPGYNAKIKTFPDGSCDILVANDLVFGRPRKKNKSAAASSTSESSILRSVRRAKSQLRDIALCNDFKWFVTLTLSPEKVKDRADPVEVIHHLNIWLDNQVRRHGLRYVLVPELHKNGAIHFHGFFSDCLPAVDSGTISLHGNARPRRPRSMAQRQEWLSSGGSIVYNLPSWTWGFSTAIELYGSYDRAVAYVCKYIGKDMKGKIGGRWYYSGGDLVRPEVTYGILSYFEYSQLPDAYCFCPLPGVFMALLHLSREEVLSL